MSKAPDQKIKDEQKNESKAITNVQDIPTVNMNEKENLLFEIRSLKLLISRAEYSLGATTTFDEVRKPQSVFYLPTKMGVDRLLDIEAALQDELYSYAGLHCKKTGEEFVFSFQSFEKNMYGNENWVQLCKIDKFWQLGQWVMPLSVNVRDVFSKYSVDSAAAMKLFLRDCKHTIDCFNKRLEEFQELERYLEDFNSCGHSVDANYGYTRVTLKLTKSHCTSSDGPRIIILYLCYKADEARPSKLQIDCEGENKLPDREARDLKQLFKVFKELDLRDAAEKVLMSEGSPFLNVGAPNDANTIDTNVTDEEEVEAESSFVKLLKKKPKTAKGKGKIAAKSDNDKKIKKMEDERENVSVDATDNFNSEDSLKEDELTTNATNLGKGRIKQTNRRRKSPREKKLRSSKQNSKSHIKSTEIGKSAKNNETEIHDNKEGNKNEELQKEKGDKIDGNADSDKNEKLSPTGIKEKGPEQSNKTGVTVPDMFKPKARQTSKILDINGKEEKDKVEKGMRRSLLSGSNPITPSVRRARRHLMCSTPIAGQAPQLPVVSEENISAIGKENMSETKKIAVEDAEASKCCNDSASFESDDKDMTKVEKSQRELLNDLQAIKHRAMEPKKPLKRKAKSPVKRRKKIARK